MSSIPDDIIFHDILSRLPVKSLLVCKRVCKNWFELISNSKFINTHLNLITQRRYFIVRSRRKHYGRTSRVEFLVHCIGYESLWRESDHQDDAGNMLFKGGTIFSSTIQDFDLLCSCNGLVCLKYRTRNKKRWICLWNPATREYKKLPKPPNTRTGQGFFKFFRCALGYDVEINDYKFVILLGFDYWDYNKILVYTLRSNSWKEIEITSSKIEKQSGVLVGGALHWLSTRMEGYSHSRCILSFDISSERSNNIQLPKEASDKGWFICLGVLEGCLCMAIFGYSADEGRGNLVTIWVMQEYGFQESWSKRYVINHERIFEKCHSHLRLLWSFENGEILFAFTGFNDLFIYDPKKKSVREPNYHGLHITEKGETYFETLVSLNSGMYLRGGNGEIEFSIEDEGE